MARRIRRTVLLLLIVLCVASAALWIRSHYRRDHVVTRWPAHGMALRSEDGTIRVDLRSTDRGPGVENAWHVTQANDWTPFDDDPFRPQSGWNYSALSFYPQSPAFAWERVQGPPPTGGSTGGGGFTLSANSVTVNTSVITSTGGGIMISPHSGARPTVGDDYLRVAFPHWLPVIVLGLLPALAGVRFIATHWRRYRRLLAGGCPICAYDLRATPGHCPECGWTSKAPRGVGDGPSTAPTAQPASL